MLCVLARNTCGAALLSDNVLIVLPPISNFSSSNLLAMRLSGKIVLLFASLAGVISASSQDISILDNLSGCTASFFERSDTISAVNKTILVDKAGKAMSMKTFFTKEKISTYGEHGIADLDNDGKKELVIYNFTASTGQCCDGIYFFRNTGADRYQLVARTYAGNVCINERDDFIYDFYAQFGNFFSCYTCIYSDTSHEGPLPVQHINMRYNKGKLLIIQGDKELKAEILDNLDKLSEQPYDPLSDTQMEDNGLRKEFALNLVVYHYSFGKSLAETKRLFDKYYKYPDAKKVWTAFHKTLQSIRSKNDF
jgi:hypothetical protein